MNRSFDPFVTSVVFALVVALATSQARAQTVDRDTLAATWALHEQAVADFDRGDYAAACPKLERVVQLIPEGLGALLTLAECYEKSGRIASAWKTYVALEAAAAKQGQSARRRAAMGKVKLLRPKLARIKLVVADGVRSLPGLELRRDQEPVAPAFFGLELPVDLGEHVIVATAHGKRRWEEKVTLQNGAVVVLRIDDLKDEDTPPPATLVKKPPEPPHEQNHAPSAQRIAGIIVGSVGLAGIGMGTFFGLRAISKNDESNAGEHCRDGNLCDDIGFALREDARSAGTVSTISLIAGGALLAGGLTLALTAGAGGGTTVAVGPQGVVLGRRW